MSQSEQTRATRQLVILESLGFPPRVTTWHQSWCLGLQDGADGAMKSPKEPAFLMKFDAGQRSGLLPLRRCALEPARSTKEFLWNHPFVMNEWSPGTKNMVESTCIHTFFQMQSQHSLNRTLQGKVEPADVMISEVSAEIPLREKCEIPKVTLRDMIGEATETNSSEIRIQRCHSWLVHWKLQRFLDTYFLRTSQAQPASLPRPLCWRSSSLQEFVYAQRLGRKHTRPAKVATEQRQKPLMYWVVRASMSDGSAKAKMLAAKDLRKSLS